MAGLAVVPACEIAGGGTMDTNAAADHSSRIPGLVDEPELVRAHGPRAVHAPLRIAHHIAAFFLAAAACKRSMACNARRSAFWKRAVSVAERHLRCEYRQVIEEFACCCRVSEC